MFAWCPRASLGKTQLCDATIKYDHFIRYLSVWLSGVLWFFPTEFRIQLGTQLGRIRGASAAFYAEFSLELWG
jgi:hypothetical protein